MPAGAFRQSLTRALLGGELGLVFAAMKPQWLRVATVAGLLATTSTACFVRGGGGLFFALADTAILTAVIVSATRPPPPRVVFVPEPRVGYAWQPGYWTLSNGDWVWVEGGWVVLQPGYAWDPAHWEETPDHRWQLMPGRWVVPAPAQSQPVPPPATAPPGGGPEYIPVPPPGT